MEEKEIKILEIEKEITWCPGYTVSNLGIIRKQGIRIGDNPDKKIGNKYLGVTLNGKRYYIHRIVGEFFCKGYGSIDSRTGALRTDINHINGNKKDNRAINLEWVTKSENMRHAKENHLWNMLLTENGKKECYQYNLNGELIRKWNSVHECEKALNINTGNVTKCCQGIFKTVGGYIFSYNLTTSEKETRELINTRAHIKQGYKVIAVRLDQEIKLDSNGNLIGYNELKKNGPSFKYNDIGPIKIYDNAHECCKDNFDFSLVCKCIRGERKSHKGYKFFKG